MSTEHTSQKTTRGASYGSAGLAVSDIPLSKTHVYNLIREGKLLAKKVGRRTIITNWPSYLDDQPNLNKAA